MLEYGSIDGSNTLFWSDGTNIYYYENGKTKSVFTSSTAVNGNINIVMALLKEDNKMQGMTNLKNLLKSEKPLCILQIKKEDLPKFKKDAKNYGVLFTAVSDKAD